MSNGKTDVFKYAHDGCFTQSFGSSRTVLLQVFDPIPNEAQKKRHILARRLVVIVKEIVFWSQMRMLGI